jgi:hypothetical protein
MGMLDILLLAFLCTAAEKDDQLVAVLAEINPVAGSEIYPAFKGTHSDALGV